MKPGNDQPGKAEILTSVNRQAVELSKQLTHVSERCRAYRGNSITEQDVSETFQNVEGFREDLFPVERNRLIRLLVDKVEIRETGIDMELRTNGLSGQADPELPRGLGRAAPPVRFRHRLTTGPETIPESRPPASAFLL